MWTWTDVNDHPRLVVMAIPAEADRLEVFEHREAVQLIAQLVIRHHCVSPVRIGTIGRNVDRNPFDPTGGHSHVFLCIVITVVRIEIDIDITPVGVVSDILDIIIDGNRIGVVGQHGL